LKASTVGNFDAESGDQPGLGDDSSQAPLGLDVALIATDHAGIIERWDFNAESLYGWSAEEVLGTSILDITVGPRDVDLASRIMSQLVAGTAWEGDFPVVRKDGLEFNAYVRDYPILADGAVTTIVGLSVPVTRTDPYAFCAARLPGDSGQLEPRHLSIEDEGPLLRLSGELDVASAPLLSEAMARLIDRGFQFIILDIEQLDFIDASGLGTLVSVRNRLVTAAGALVLRSPSPAFHRVLSIVDLARVFAIEG
jgi:anti-sigma B factor antagonist